MHKYVNIVFRQENIGQDIEWIFAIKDSKKAIFLFKWIYFRAASIWLRARTLSVHIQAISINCFVPHRPKHQSSFRKIKSTKMETAKNVCFRLPTPANFSGVVRVSVTKVVKTRSWKTFLSDNSWEERWQRRKRSNQCFHRIFSS